LLIAGWKNTLLVGDCLLRVEKTKTNKKQKAMNKLQ